MDNAIQIVNERGHYVVYIHGEKFCSADTYEEAVKELEREGFVM